MVSVSEQMVSVSEQMVSVSEHLSELAPGTAQPSKILRRFPLVSPLVRRTTPAGVGCWGGSLSKERRARARSDRARGGERFYGPARQTPGCATRSGL